MGAGVDDETARALQTELACYRALVPVKTWQAIRAHLRRIEIHGGNWINIDRIPTRTYFAMETDGLSGAYVAGGSRGATIHLLREHLRTGLAHELAHAFEDTAGLVHTARDMLASLQSKGVWVSGDMAWLNPRYPDYIWQVYANGSEIAGHAIEAYYVRGRMWMLGQPHGRQLVKWLEDAGYVRVGAKPRVPIRKLARESDKVDEVTRYAVYIRDGNTCVYCLTSLTLADHTLDHVRPLSRGGTNNPRNLVACCTSCNSARRPPTGFCKCKEEDTREPETRMAVTSRIVEGVQIIEDADAETASLVLGSRISTLRGQGYREWVRDGRPLPQRYPGPLPPDDDPRD